MTISITHRNPWSAALARSRGSHVREDGIAKEAYATRAIAAKVADDRWVRTGQPCNPYMCSQAPEHWHVGHGTPDLKRP